MIILIHCAVILGMIAGLSCFILGICMGVSVYWIRVNFNIDLENPTFEQVEEYKICSRHQLQRIIKRFIIAFILIISSGYILEGTNYLIVHYL